ncbi:MAG: PucC family protein, partial [Thermoflexales bacterium]|nr:PucC family protein [Thermoflexales bacterium]
GLISSASLSKQVLPFVLGASIIGVASGLFLISTLAWVVSLADVKTAGLYVGMWGLVQTTAAGLGALGGSNLRDLVIRTTGNVAQSYTTVYVVEMALLAVALILFAFMPRELLAVRTKGRSAFAGLTEIPGS